MTLREQIVEAMARALCKSERGEWERATERGRGGYLFSAGRALAALQSVCNPLGIKLTAREPTEDQQSVGGEAISDYFGNYDSERDWKLALEVWRQEHDAAPDLLEG